MKKDNIKELRSSDIFSHIPEIGYIPRWSVLLLDMVLCTVAFWLSVWIGGGFFNYLPESAEIYSYGLQYLLVMAVQVLTFWIFHTYSGIIRFSTFVDVVKVLGANLSAGVIILLFNLVMHLTTGSHPILNTVVVIYISVSFVLLFSLRVAVKTFGEMLEHHGTGSPRVMIYGTKYAGVAIAKMLRSAGNTPYHPVGFITNSDERFGFDLVGLPVRQLNEQLFDWMAKRNIQHVIVSPLKMHEINPAEDLQIFIDHNIRILTTPYFTPMKP